MGHVDLSLLDPVPAHVSRDRSAPSREVSPASGHSAGQAGTTDRQAPATGPALALAAQRYPSQDRHKYKRAAAMVRGMIADGTLQPGQRAPSAAALSRATGFAKLTCRKALTLLLADGTLLPGHSTHARPRVPGRHPAAAGAASTELAARALSSGLATRRHAASTHRRTK